MKRITLALFFAMAIMISSVAQTYEPYYAFGTGSIGDGPLQNPLLECPDSAIFSQPPIDFQTFNAFTSDLSLQYKVFDDFVLYDQTDIKGITFWGITPRWEGNPGFVACGTEDPITFEIRFFVNNGGQVGAQVASFVLQANKIHTGHFNSYYWGDEELLRYDVEFPSSFSLNGFYWVSVFATSVSNPDCQFLWQSSDNQGSTKQLNMETGIYNNWPYEMSFCIIQGKKAKEYELPLSDWAIVLGVVLIGTAIWFRRMRITA